jgi:hypothetical protein
MGKKKQPLGGSAPVDDARRNWFAGLAMQALLPDEASKHALQIDAINAHLVARVAYKVADAMEAEATRLPSAISVPSAPDGVAEPMESEVTPSIQPHGSGGLIPSMESECPNSVTLPPPRLPEGVFDPRPKQTVHPVEARADGCSAQPNRT